MAKETQDEAHNVNVLCLFDEVLREIAHGDTTLDVWKKLEDLYM